MAEDKVYFDSKIDPKMNDWARGIEYLSKKYPERAGFYQGLMQEHLAAIRSANVPSNAGLDPSDYHATASRRFEEGKRNSFHPRSKEAAYWNDLSYEVNQDWSERLLYNVFDKRKAQEHDSFVAGIKPGGVIGAVLGVVGASKFFNLDGLELAAVGTVMAIGMSYGGRLIEDKIRDYAATPAKAKEPEKPETARSITREEPPAAGMAAAQKALEQAAQKVDSSPKPAAPAGGKDVPYTESFKPSGIPPAPRPPGPAGKENSSGRASF